MTSSSCRHVKQAKIPSSARFDSTEFSSRVFPFVAADPASIGSFLVLDCAPGPHTCTVPTDAAKGTRQRGDPGSRVPCYRVCCAGAIPRDMAPCRPPQTFSSVFSRRSLTGDSPHAYAAGRFALRPAQWWSIPPLPSPLLASALLPTAATRKKA